MFKTIPIAVAITFLLFTSNVNAFWRLLCDGNVGLARIDPLVAPGGPSDHVHSIKGGSGESFLFVPSFSFLAVFLTFLFSFSLH